MPKYIFHVGPPKTGSKFIQSQLFHSRQYLAQKGVFYPDFWLTYVTHHPLTDNLKDGKDLKDEFDKLNACGYDTVIFSSETFDELRLPVLERLKQYIGNSPVEIVCYVRRWSDRIPSIWRETVAAGYYATLPEYYAKVMTAAENIGVVNYVQSWSRFEKVFGRDSLRLVSFDNLIGHGVDLFENFCEAILELRDVPKVDASLIYQNAGLGTIKTEILRALNFLYFAQTSRVDPAMYEKFTQQVQDGYDLQTIEGHLKTDMRELQIDDDVAELRSTWAAHLRSTWNAMNAYLDRLVSPEYGKEFFRRRTARVQYVGQNYLLRQDAAGELMKLYKWMGRSELNVGQRSEGKSPPQNLDAEAPLPGA